MKKIFLTSIASEVLDNIAKVLDVKSKKLKVLFISTAANPNQDKQPMLNDLKNLRLCGFDVELFDISDKNELELEKVTKNIDVIFFSGGNTFYLMQEITNTGFDIILKRLIESGVIYIGSSAGSAILGPTIEYVKYFDDPGVAPKLYSFDGLKILNFLLLPHFNQKKVSSKFNLIKKEFYNFDIEEIKDNQFIFINGNKIKKY